MNAFAFGIFRISSDENEDAIVEMRDTSVRVCDCYTF